MSLVWKSDLFTESLGTHDYPMIGGGGAKKGGRGDDGGGIGRGGEGEEREGLLN